MRSRHPIHPVATASSLAVWMLAAQSACVPEQAATDLTDLATRYAAAWSSQSPVSLASFYAEDGSLTVNAGAPSVGREAIRATAEGFMTAFPDMVVVMDSVIGEEHYAVFHWTWTGTNTGPGGTGRAVRISGYEEWTLDTDGLIAESKGHYDEAEYQRQMAGEQ